jgi:hypothetical protein
MINKVEFMDFDEEGGIGQTTEVIEREGLFGN